MFVYEKALWILRLLCLFLLPIAIMLHEMNFTNGILYLSFFICFFRLKEEQARWKNFDRQFFFLIICFCFGLIISNYYSTDLSISMKWARRYCYWILLGAAIYGLWTRENIGRYLFASGLALGGIILCVYAGYQDLVLDLNRPGSLSTGPNSFSAIVALAVPFVLLNIPNLLFNILTWLIFLSGIAISQSRGSFLALTFVSFFYCLNELRMRWSFTCRQMIALLLSIMALCGLLFIMDDEHKTEPGILQRLLNTSKISGDDERILLWKSSFNMIKDFPVHGVGLRQFNDIYINKNYINVKVREPHLDSPHNIILHYLTEMGLIGTVPLVALFVYIVYWSAKNRENIMARAMLYAMAALFINNMVDYQFIVKQYYQLFWVLCGGTIADVYLKKEKFICG